MSKTQGTPIYAGRKVIGHVVGDEFRKSVDKRRHFLNKPRAIALSLDSLNESERVGARFVRVHETSESREYWASVATIRARGFRLARSLFEAQIALLLGEWDATRLEAQARDEAREAKARAPVAKQLPLETWGGQGCLSVDFFEGREKGAHNV